MFFKLGGTDTSKKKIGDEEDKSPDEEDVASILLQ